MSFSVATLEALQAEGLDLAACIRVLSTVEPKPDTAAEKRRAWDRDRKAGKRAERKSGGMSGGSPPDKGSNDRDILTSKSPPNVISSEITPPPQNDDEPILKPEHVVEAWNEMAARTGLPAIRKLTTDRMRSLSRRIKENTIQDFTEAIDAIERSPFLRGDTKRGWRANFDFLLSPTKFNRILEGTYGE